MVATSTHWSSDNIGHRNASLAYGLRQHAVVPGPVPDFKQDKPFYTDSVIEELIS